MTAPDTSPTEILDMRPTPTGWALITVAVVVNGNTVQVRT
jgi:hypothetical protein